MIKENISLKEMTNYKIGGPARFFLSVNTKEELIESLKKWPKISAKNGINQNKIFILGGGTNILVDDAGFNGLVIHTYFDEIEILEDCKIKVGSGVSVKKLNDYLIENSLSGFEWSGGLPGTLGGAIFGNAGAFGRELKDSIVEVESLEFKTLRLRKRDFDECEFDYRNSIFKKNFSGKEIIISAIFQFDKGDPVDLRKSVDEKIFYRIEHQPLELPSAGSTFKNVPLESLSEEIRNKFNDKIKQDPFSVIPAAVFLADAKLKGFSIGGAQISEKHPNFIVNIGGATSEDVEKLIDQVIKIVIKKYDIILEPEVVRVK